MEQKLQTQAPPPSPRAPPASPEARVIKPFYLTNTDAESEEGVCLAESHLPECRDTPVPRDRWYLKAAAACR